MVARRLRVFPVVLGSGKRIFGESNEKSLRLVDSKVVGDGVAILIYEAAGEKRRVRSPTRSR